MSFQRFNVRRTYVLDVLSQRLFFAYGRRVELFEEIPRKLLAKRTAPSFSPSRPFRDIHQHTQAHLTDQVADIGNFHVPACWHMDCTERFGYLNGATHV